MYNLKSTIYQTGWLDLVFENRNKSYGAYELRENYNKRLLQSLIIASGLVLVLFSFPLLKKHFQEETVIPPKVIDKEKITIVDLPHLLHKPVPPAAKPAKAMPEESAVQKLKTTAFNEPKVVNTLTTVEPPTLTQLQTSVVSSTTTEGQETQSNATVVQPGSPGGAETGNGTGEGTGEELVSAALLQKYPEFPGGMGAFANFLRKNLRYPEHARENGIGGKVVLSFVVEKDGRLTDIKILRGIGYGCDEEAARVLRKSPAWNAGMQNDKMVRVLYTIPLSFQLAE